MHETDSPDLRKHRGAFFTPPEIAEFLAGWAVAGDASARVLDPTCGEAVFLLAAAQRLTELGTSTPALRDQVTGIDLHSASLDEAKALLRSRGLDATMHHGDFFDVPTPSQLVQGIGWHDAVLGNPPFVRYQAHRGTDRAKAVRAAFEQGVRLSGLASSWAATLVHASSFLKPDGRLAMVVPAELLTVGYAEPIRRWLRGRFAAVSLVMFDQLQFADATEQVVLLVARGSGGCEAFSIFHVGTAADLKNVHALDAFGVAPAHEGKWTDLVLPSETRRIFKHVISDNMKTLDDFGVPELGTVTGANDYFALSDATRLSYELGEEHFKRISPPGTKHLTGLTFTPSHWDDLRCSGSRVWLLHPDPDSTSEALRRYVEVGEKLKVDEAYKCSIRTPWWRPPAVSPPDLFFTYMSHNCPRLISNAANVTLLNSMHGVRLRPGVPVVAKEALPVLSLNSAALLGAEVFGRSYGGGILKMEPREASSLPVPNLEHLARAWEVLRRERSRLDQRVRKGRWSEVVERVDQVLLVDTVGLKPEWVSAMRSGAELLRRRRMRTTKTSHGN